MKSPTTATHVNRIRSEFEGGEVLLTQDTPQKEVALGSVERIVVTRVDNFDTSLFSAPASRVSRQMGTVIIWIGITF